MKGLKQWMSGILAAVMVLLLIPAMPITAEAAQTAGTAEWTYETYGEGIVLTAYSGTATDVYVPAKVGGKTVLKLGDSLFADNDGLNSVTLAEGITEIGSKTFYDADNLVCIVTNETLTTIGTQAFESCDSFNSIILYDAVTAIGANAFAACPKLTIWCNEDTAGYTYATTNGISYEILNPEEIPQTVKLDNATYYISNGTALLMSVAENTRTVIPSQVENVPVSAINAGALGGLYKGEIFLPDTIIEVPEDFTYYNGVVLHCGEGSALHQFLAETDKQYILTKSNAEPTVISVDGFDFYMYPTGEAALKAYTGTSTVVEVPATANGATVTKVLPHAFKGSPATEIKLPDTINYMYPEAFYCGVTKVNIPTATTCIANDLFFACYSLEEVQLHDGIKCIHSDAFGIENKITEMVLPDSVEFIEEWAFRGSPFTQINYPVNATMEKDAFYNSDVQTVIVPAETKTLSIEAFSRNVVFYVYTDTTAHKTCMESGALYSCIDGNFAEPYEYTDCVEYYDEEQDSWYSGTITYLVLGDHAVLMRADISSWGYTDNYDVVYYGVEKYVIPEYIEGVPVTAIAAEAFYECGSVRQLTIPETVTSIGNFAFYECASLEYLELPDGITRIREYTFSECTALKSMVLPDNLETIDQHAFDGCGIESLEFPQSLQKIGEWAFTDSGLKTLNYPNVDVGDYVFTYCKQLQEVRIEEGVTEIPLRCFMMCPELVYIYTPSSLQSIDENAFAFCVKAVFVTNDLDWDALVIKYAREKARYYIDEFWGSRMEFSEVTIDGITYWLVLGYFMETSGRKATVIGCDPSVTGHVTIPDSIVVDGQTYDVFRIGDNAFQYANITSIDLPEDLYAIGDSAFQSSQLKNIKLPKNLPYLGVNVFCNTQIEEFTFPVNYTSNFGMFASTNALKKVTIPEGVTVIPEYTFAMCNNLENIVLPQSLKKIETEAIWNMHGNITELTIPGGVELEKRSIVGIATLKKVVFEEGITSIPNILTSCKSLSLVYLPRSVTYISYEAFENSPNTVLCVYEDSYALEYAQKRCLPYFILRETENPEIAYGAGITGTVTYTDGAAASNATVDILYSDGTVKETVETGTDGTYAFTYAEVGAYSVRATDAAGNTATTQVSVKRMNAFDVFLTGDTDLKLKKGYAVSGTANGAGTVTLTDRDGNVLASQGTSDGSFTFTDVPNGTYIITVQTATGSASQEITVFNGDVSEITLTVAATAATIWGYVEVENRDGTTSRRNWVQVTVYNAEGLVVTQTKSDKDGKYTFENLPMGQYAITAETAEMRPDQDYGYDRSHTLTGYANVEVAEAKEYQAETIVLREVNETKTTLSGKVTANGETQDCRVVLADVFRNEIASYITAKNGKYAFANVRDGQYFITATTKSDGMGYTVVTVLDGQIHGTTDIRVYKADSIQAREDKFVIEVPDLANREEAQQYRDRIAEEKRFYDSLSEKEKKQLSADYIERLNRYVEWLANYSYEAAEGVSVEQGGLVISGEELANEDEITFNLNVEKTDAWTVSPDGIHTAEDYLYHDAHDTAGHRNVAQYYEITMSKTVDGEEVPITSIRKDTDTTGKLRITMPIPEEYRGHKHYSVLHIHEGEPVILTDLDADPDTVTFEVDKFSIFILLETDEEATAEVEEDVVDDSLTALIANSADGAHLVLEQDITEDVVVDKNIYLDLKGYSINGSVTVAEGFTLYVKDSQTDDYTVEDGNGYGKITGTVSGVVAQSGYMMITENGETSFHRLNLDTVGLSLRADAVGVYYQSQFGGDEVIKRNIVAYGTALGAGQMPNFADKTYTRFADMTTWKPGMNASGYSNNLKNGTILQGIMNTTNGYSTNKYYGDMKIYSQAYVELPDGTRILGNSVSYSLRDILEGTNTIAGVDQYWSSLKDSQRQPVLQMYATYKRIMQSWNIPNIKTAAQ